MNPKYNFLKLHIYNKNNEFIKNHLIAYDMKLKDLTDKLYSNFPSDKILIVEQLSYKQAYYSKLYCTINLSKKEFNF